VVPRPPPPEKAELNPVLSPAPPAGGGQAPPGDAPPQEPEVAVSSRGIWIAGIGATVAIAAVILVPVSSSHINDDRTALQKECMTLVVNDSCMALPGHGPAAQSLADSIATWKAIQTGAKVGIGVGAAAIVVGLIVRYRDGADAAAATTAARPALVFDQKDGQLRPGLAWSFRF
jgi:hypothetical protein